MLTFKNLIHHFVVPLVSPAGSGTSRSDSPPDCNSTLSVSLRYPRGEGRVLRLALWESCRGATEREGSPV